MKDAEKLITELVLKTVEPMPPLERARYYRALATLTSDDALVEVLAKLADAMETVASLERQSWLDLKKS